MLNLKPPSNEKQTLDIKESKTMTQSACRWNCQALASSWFTFITMVWKGLFHCNQNIFYILVYYYHLVFYPVCMSVLFACMCTMCMPGVQESQERVLDPVEHELQIVMIHYVSFGSRIQVLCRSNKCS